MLTLAVVHKKTMRSAKLHVLTREAVLIKQLLQIGRRLIPCRAEVEAAESRV